LVEGKDGTRDSILIVDDALFFRHLLTELLEGRGYRVVVAATGEEVPHLLSAEEFSVVLTDLEMPGISGSEVLRRVKRQNPDIPVIIISSHREFEIAREILREGAIDYLVKPLQEDELFASVERGISSYNAARRAAAMQQEARRHLSDLVLLKEIGETAGTGADLQNLFDKILDSIKSAADVEIVSLMLLEDNGTMKIRGARGLSKELVETVRVAPGEGISGHVLATGEAVLLDDLSRDNRFISSGGGKRYKTGSLLSVPIMSKDRVIGVLNVNNKRSGETFTAVDQNLLTTIAHQAALAIENFELVSNLRRQARELEEANRKLVKLNQARSRLVCNLSHELKTPLTSIMGYVDIILNFGEHIAPDETADYLGRVYAESQHLEKIISGMLRLFSIDSGKESWDWRSFALEEVLAGALKGVSEEIVSKGVRTEVSLEEALCPLYGDAEKGGVLFSALIDNAVKFNRPGGAMRILAENRAIDALNYVYVRIYNDGRSIPSAAGEDVFEQYAQLGDLDTDKPEGVGVGLAICRAIVERMKGNIYLEETEGEGTSFALLLPTRESYEVLSNEKK